MSNYTATVSWQRGEQVFSDDAYSRGHQWEFDGGAVVPASASPDVVPLPMSVAENVDPEEAFIASISSCHMLFFLSIASRRGFVVDDYVDEAIGVMGKNKDGKTAVTKVTLHPRATYSGAKIPDMVQIEKMHHRAHELCFIANSVSTLIETEIQA